MTFCNLKTKNYLHTHKIKLPSNSKVNEVSACPYTSNHILEYDLWKIIQIDNSDRVYIYHPFTQKFLGLTKNSEICCDDEKYEWKMKDFGRRRNGGFTKLTAYSNN